MKPLLTSLSLAALVALAACNGRDSAGNNAAADADAVNTASATDNALDGKPAADAADGNAVLPGDKPAADEAVEPGEKPE